MFFNIVRVLKILHRRILQKPFIVFGVIPFQFLIFRSLFGFNVVQCLLLAIACDAESSQQPRLFQPIVLLNVIQVLAHAQDARRVIIRLVRINHGQIQTQHGVRAGNAHLLFAHLNHVVAVARHWFVNEGHLLFSHRNVVMLRHNLTDARVLGHHHILKIVVFQPFFDLASAGLRVN